MLRTADPDTFPPFGSGVERTTGETLLREHATEIGAISNRLKWTDKLFSYTLD